MVLVLAQGTAFMIPALKHERISQDPALQKIRASLEHWII
jgi:hypothetical protein